MARHGAGWRAGQDTCALSATTSNRTDPIMTVRTAITLGWMLACLGAGGCRPAPAGSATPVPSAGPAAGTAAGTLSGPARARADSMRLPYTEADIRFMTDMIGHHAQALQMAGAALVITSLEGYGAADGWPGFWGLEGPEYLAWLGEQAEADYTTLMGANTYRLMSGLAADGEPGTEALADMPKIVFSSTLTEPLSWPNTRLLTQDAVEGVRDMKDEGTESMRTLGSLTLCRSLVRAGLVDRFRVVVFPVITGSSGKDRIYDGYPDVSLEMVSSRLFDGRLQLLEYVPTVLARPPLAAAESSS